MEGLSSFILSSLVRGCLLGDCCRRQIPMYIADYSMWQKSINQWKWDSRTRLPFSASIIHWLKTPTPSKTLCIPLNVQQMCQTIKGSITLSRRLWISVLQIIINKKEYAFILNAITYHLISMYHTLMFSMQYQNITQTTCSVLD